MQKILIIRFSSIGDIVLTTPVIRCLKNQLGDTEIHFLTKKQYEPLLQVNPYIDHLWLYDHNFKSLVPALKKEHFDFIADLHHNIRSAFVRCMLRRPSATFSKLNIQKWLMVNFKWNFLPDVHIVDRYFKTVSSFRILNDGEGLDHFIPEQQEVDPAQISPSFRDGYIVVVIGGKHHTKIFPVDKVTEVCRRLDVPVILLGGEEDFERGEEVVRAVGTRVINGCGLFTLNQAASLIFQSDSVLTNDTGMMHIAAAFCKRMVSVWGNTIPAFGMTPYMPTDDNYPTLIAEVHGLSCRPCSKLGFRECPRKHFRCMNDIDVGEIVQFLKSSDSPVDSSSLGITSIP
jgi:ADP-heptose:LPS heptosyltransferase